MASPRSFYLCHESPQKEARLCLWNERHCSCLASMRHHSNQFKSRCSRQHCHTCLGCVSFQFTAWHILVFLQEETTQLNLIGHFTCCFIQQRMVQGIASSAGSCKQPNHRMWKYQHSATYPTTVCKSQSLWRAFFHLFFTKTFSSKERVRLCQDRRSVSMWTGSVMFFHFSPLSQARFVHFIPVF